MHTKFVGAFDAIILASLAAATVGMLLVLLEPSFDHSSTDMMSKRATVTVEQIA